MKIDIKNFKWIRERCFGGNILRAYKNKEKLKTEINKTFEKYILEFDSVPETLKNAQRN